ncbi:hypothetical protein KP509_23G047800 [Ceratopteris richardii]|uniref:Arginyl-tRNA--protein transferase n=1 Tax=Ceratopteris richardii TaxID=49495 RepID=A0A8T2S1B0_CERRI|nr:hypothetical protein KP509_23G047800 [Ceratopteris richardii]KAH7301901.1 hypothetical protein KP509_23G047800 [Ceratopteris richardii]
MMERGRAANEPKLINLGRYARPCGYCKSSKETSVTYELWAHSLSVDDYQCLLDRGWRRRGNALFKPEMKETCCPQYTIRLKVESFCASKEQNRVMRRMQRYLDGTYTDRWPSNKRESDLSAEQNSPKVNNLMLDSSSEMFSCAGVCNQTSRTENSVKTCDDADTVVKQLCDAVRDALESCRASGLLPADLEAPTILVQRVKPTVSKRIKTAADGQVRYSCNVAFSLAALLSKHKESNLFLGALQKTVDRAEQHNNNRNTNNVCHCFFAEVLASMLRSQAEMHECNVVTWNGYLNFVLPNLDGFGIQNRKVMSSNEIVKGDIACADEAIKEKSTKLEEKSTSSILLRDLRPRRVLEIRMERSAFDPEEFALFKRYQMAVHHDGPDYWDENSYINFLVSSPLKFVPSSPSETVFGGFGSFHQQYIIDGRLIAVGVVDILPCCLSSTYFFWDPDYAFLSLGKYSALREIEWVRSARTVCLSMEFYYLGYYIHTCPKMRYKGAYQPSELLCPIKYQWVPLEKAEPFLDRHALVDLSNCMDTDTRPSLDNNPAKKELKASVKDGGKASQ